MFRSDLPWVRAAAASLGDGDELSEIGARVRDHLAARGACFLTDIAAALEVPATEIEEALWELVAAGLATADGFASLRVLVDRRRGELKSRYDEGADARAPRGRWRETIRKARRRDAARPGLRGRSLAAAAGRWSLLGPPDPEAMCPESWARQLLCRYGVVFRDLVVREPCLPPWREILWALRRLEARGEIRGGRFVAGFVGEQFALPEALEGLRGLRAAPRAPEIVHIAATDPLNLVGVTSAGPKVAAVIGNEILYRNGVPIASLEAGERIIRSVLGPGESVDESLEYHNTTPVELDSFQVQLPI